MLTFKNIQDHVLTYLDQVGDTDHGLDLVKLAIQTAHHKRLTQERWSFMLWPTPTSLTFVGGQRNYVLHSEVQFVTDFWHTQAEIPLRETPTRARFKGGVQDDRFHFEFVQHAPVKVQPVQGVVTVSGNARVRYIDQNGDVQSEDVSAADTNGTVKEILNVTRLAAGTITLTDVSANLLLSLSSTEYGRQYPQIRLFADGVAGETANYRFYRKSSPLDHDNDIPDIPYPFSRILIFDSLLELYTYDDSAPPAYWVAQQGQWEMALRQAYVEGEMEGSESRVIQMVDTYEG